MKLWFVVKRRIKVPESVTAATARLISQPTVFKPHTGRRQDMVSATSKRLQYLGALLPMSSSDNTNIYIFVYVP